jgi:hypothetical protein
VVFGDAELIGSFRNDKVRAIDVFGQRHRADPPDLVNVELQADKEEQHGDADLSQQVDLRLHRHEAQHRGAGRDADQDEGDDQRLAQEETDRASDRGDQ